MTKAKDRALLGVDRERTGTGQCAAYVRFVTVLIQFCLFHAASEDDNFLWSRVGTDTGAAVAWLLGFFTKRTLTLVCFFLFYQIGHYKKINTQ